MHSIFNGDEAVGIVTSAAFGHRMQKAIGLTYFRDRVSADDELHAEILGRKVSARITSPI